MGWKFISGEQADEKTKLDAHKKQDVVRFIVDAEEEKDKINPVIQELTALVRFRTQGMSEQELITLESRLHDAITEILRSRD